MRKRIFPLLIFILFSASTFAQNKLKKQIIADSLSRIANEQIFVGKVRVPALDINKGSNEITVFTSSNLGTLPFREASVERIYKAIAATLPAQYAFCSLQCKVLPDSVLIDDLVANYYRTKNEDENRKFRIEKPAKPLLTEETQAYKIDRGLQNRYLALWNSHGLYYNQDEKRWKWQRARLLQTVEDLYTAAWVLPLLTPMLENAGARVFLPRERDTQPNEVIIDNDNATYSYTETNGNYQWENGNSEGFANKQTTYQQGENPFQLGTFRQVKTQADSSQTSSACYFPDIPKAGYYAVYVSYKTLENSTEDALYTVLSQGIEHRFRINQTMGGGTWIYLGSFYFPEGQHPDKSGVVLSNHSNEVGKILTADAVKFGGGKGNIARQSSTQIWVKIPVDTICYNEPDTINCCIACDSLQPVLITPDTPKTSGFSRYAEGARYWLQWAGMPDSVYSKSCAKNDYIDDLQSRSAWVNHLAGGSALLPNQSGLGIPLELVLAFHTDAGKTVNDSVIGTMAIFTGQNDQNEKKYPNGISRMASRDLADIVISQITDDIRRLYNPRWTNRGIFNRSYNETREPSVPSIIIEALSHQNFADMNLGLDPAFRFHFCRAIYKGILKYFESVDGNKLLPQPLPVKEFSSTLSDKNEVTLRWTPVADPLDPMCVASRYLVYTRIDSGSFDNGRLVDTPRWKTEIETDKIYSFYVTAVNDGGESFPSEILSVCQTKNTRNEVLIVNAFDRISVPKSFTKGDSLAGFLAEEDAGMPYISDMSFVGKQIEFHRNKEWRTDDDPGFGESQPQYEGMNVAGNSFDYPFVHGQAIREAGYSFSSGSRDAVMAGHVALSNYKTVDIILGKQKQERCFNFYLPEKEKFKTFPSVFRSQVRNFCLRGGNLIVSGANIISDNRASEADSIFVSKILKVKMNGAPSIKADSIYWKTNDKEKQQQKKFTCYTRANSENYYIEKAEIIRSTEQPEKTTILEYAQSGESAGIITQNKRSKVCVLGFPFETIKENDARRELMHLILRALR